MSIRRPIWIAALYGFLLLVCSISDAKADRRVALVVGNSHYSNASLFLANPKNDAEDVAAALRGIGFEVIGLAGLAFLDHRDRRTLVAASVAAVVLVGFQAWLGRETVRLGNSGESVTAHLASAIASPGRRAGSNARTRSASVTR